MLEFHIWLLIALAIFIAEIFIPGIFIIWFSLGALLTGLLVKAGLLNSALLQWGFFSISSVAMFLVGFTLIKHLTRKKKDAEANKVYYGIVSSDINPPRTGMVELEEGINNITDWYAIANTPIASGTRVIVTDRSGINLMVEEIRPEQD